MTYNVEAKKILKNRSKNDEDKCFYSLYKNSTTQIDWTKVKTGKIGVLSIGKLDISQNKDTNKENVIYGTHRNDYTADDTRSLNMSFQYLFVRPVKKLSLTTLNKQLIYLEVENPVTDEVLNLFDTKYIAKLPTFNYKGKDCYLFVIDATTNIFNYEMDFEVETIKTENSIEDKMTLTGNSHILNLENVKLKENNFIDYFVNNFDKEISFTYDLESLESNKSWNETTTVYPSSFLYTFEDTGLKVVNLNYNEIYFSGMRTMKFDFTNILIRSNNLTFQSCQSFWNKEGKIYVKSAGWGKSDLETSLLNTFFEKIEPEEIKEEPVLNNNEIEVENFNDVIAKMKAPEIDEYYEVISNNLNKWETIFSLSSLNNIDLPNDLKSKIRYLHKNHKQKLDSLVKLIK
jgi:hypothetical protein